MGGEPEKSIAHSVRKKEMARFFGVRGLELRTSFDAANFLERAGEATRVARELHGGSVSEKLALPADRGLDQTPEQNADPADDDEREPEQR